MTSDVLADLFGNEVDHDELLELLIGHFGGAQQADNGDILIPGARADKLRVKAAGERLGAISRGPSLTATELSELQAEVRSKLVTGQAPGVGSGIGFSLAPVDGWFRAPGGAFQILPAPPAAPRPPVAYAEHPFLLEFPLVRSPDSLVNINRRARSSSEWIWFLNAVLTERVSQPRRRSRHAWVICPDDVSGLGPARPPVWAQEYYDIPGLEAFRDDFSLPSGDPIRFMPSDAYYGAPGIVMGRPLTLPESLPESARRFSNLAGSDRTKFLRAAQWIAAAHDLWDAHISSYYVALVAAIEALAYEPQSVDRCSKCGRDKNQRPTAAFKDFLIAYAPGSGSRTQIDDLYRFRSGIVHGTALLDHDSPGAFHFKASALAQDERMSRLSRLVRVVVVNWLAGHG